MEIKTYGNGNYHLDFYYYGYGEWNKITYKCKTFKTAYRKARLIQKQYKGALYHFFIFDCTQNKMRWSFQSITEATRWCNRLYLRQGEFTHIVGYVALARE